MARTFGKLLCEVWDDPKHEDFLTLSSDAKVLYWAFCSQRDITAAGVVPLTPRRWRKWFGGDAAAPERALDELVDHGFVMIDDDTAEVWVRSFLNHDGRLDNSNLAKSVHTAVAIIRSEALRRACERRLAVALGGPDDDPEGTEIPDPVDNPSDADQADETAGRRAFEGRSKGDGNEPARDPELLDLRPGTFDRAPRTSSSPRDAHLALVRTPDDDDDFEAAVGLIVEARCKGRTFNKSERGYKAAVSREAQELDGELIRRMLADGTKPDEVAAFVLRDGFVSEAEKAKSTVPWCGPDCDVCGGDAWVEVDGGLAPCPNRSAETA